MALRRSLGLLVFSCAVALTLGVPDVRAQQARAVGATPPRLSFVDGEVSYWRPGADDWVPAQVNTALGAGDSLYAGDGGNFELEIGARAYVRGGSGTQLGVESLETGYLQLRVPAGFAAIDLRRIPDGQEIELDTPNGAFLISHTGYYRFDVDDQSARLTVRRGGIARVVPAGGSDEVEVEVDSGQTVVVRGTDTGDLARVAPAGEDAWDRWNYDRTAGLSDEPQSVRYVSSDVAGVDDLDRYGDWRPTPTYGQVWVPRGVASGWSPYTTGRWVWDGYYGWTWVDDAPWGWAPYHYGRWCWVDGYWGWAPGPVVARPVYSPALVAFFGGGGVGVSIGIGTPFVSWVPLGWGEPVVPWWGPRGFVGRPYWGGWGGPRVVNNTVVNNTTIVNVNNIDRYDNVRHRAVVGVDGNRFGRGRLETVRVDPDRVRDMRPVRGELGIRPVRESLVPREGRGRRPPERIQSRQVVGTRAPQDPSRLPRSRGLIRETEAARRSAPRLVAPRGSGGMNRLERTGGRNEPPPVLRGMERGAVERTRGGVERGVGERSERGGPTRGGNDEPTRRIEQPRMPRETGVERSGRPERMPRNEAPEHGMRMQQSAPPARGEQPDRQPRNEASRPRNEGPREVTPPRAFDGGGRDRGAERQRIEQPRTERRRVEPPRERRIEAPRQQRMEAPRQQRMEAPREQRREAPRQPRMEAPRAQRLEAPRPERMEVPRQQRQDAPRVERGAGEPRGGGVRDNRGGGKRDREG
ncbi:MAG: hypothetical protein IT293_03090 [Deltaproteobacteria bacterium]|nr:hypothetical protein [Deltaproteobacteria bacterium]